MSFKHGCGCETRKWKDVIYFDKKCKIHQGMTEGAILIAIQQVKK